MQGQADDARPTVFEISAADAVSNLFSHPVHHAICVEVAEWTVTETTSLLAHDSQTLLDIETTAC